MLQDITLRLGVWGVCNFKCQYCPTFMEAVHPDFMNDLSALTNDEIVDLMRIASEQGLRKVSLTGGEPLLRPKIEELIYRLKHETLLDVVEMTSNASLISKKIELLKNTGLDFIKISLDSFEQEKFQNITRTKLNVNRVHDGIRIAVESGIPVALNAVVLKENMNELEAMIDFAEEVGANLHLLDLVFYEDTKEYWKKQFLPLEKLIPKLRDKYGESLEVDRFGCKFYAFDTGKIVIRLKDSLSATMRADMCKTCTEFCQEGIYSIKFSPQGWITSCPSQNKDKGFNIHPHQKTPSEIAKSFSDLGDLIASTYPDNNSFNKLLEVRNIKYNLAFSE